MQEVRDVQRLCEVGTFAQIVQLNPTDEGLHVLLRGHRRIKLDGTVQTEPCGPSTLNYSTQTSDH